MIPETVGTLSLKIVRLRQQLTLLQQQQALSSAYPDFQEDLIRKQVSVEHQLRQLAQNKEELQQYVSQHISQGVFNEKLNR